MTWNQKTITKWSVETFGPVKPLSICTRAHKEMCELVESLVDHEKGGSSLEAAVEAADVTIFMMQICEKLGYDLNDLIQKKMDINKVRSWTIAEDGTAQHVQEEGEKLKLTMTLNGHDLVEGKCKICGREETNETCVGF